MHFGKAGTVCGEEAGKRHVCESRSSSSGVLLGHKHCPRGSLRRGSFAGSSQDGGFPVGGVSTELGERPRVGVRS